MASDKHITLRLTRTNWGGNIQTTQEERADVVNSGRTVQAAVREFYPLPGASHCVSLWRNGVWVAYLWSNDERGENEFRQDWYPTIHDGDVVEIHILRDEDQDPPAGPAGGLVGKHPKGAKARGCSSVQCNLAALARLWSC
jgi:hypothetical protein